MQGGLSLGVACLTEAFTELSSGPGSSGFRHMRVSKGAGFWTRGRVAVEVARGH